MSKKGQIFTPGNYVIQLLDNVGYIKNLFGKKFLENSCGDGQILIETVKRYIEDCHEHNYDNSLIVRGLEKDIYGIEIDEVQLDICRRNLDKLVSKYGLSQVNWQLFNEDFLNWEISGNFLGIT